MGIAAPLTRVLEAHKSETRRWSALSLPVLLGMVLLQAGWIVGSDRLKAWREANRALPPADAPNVLLVVLDTVRADHLSAYGYERPTSPNLQRLAARGVRFDQARATAPWTLASHASLFTGRWSHEVSSRWMHPLRPDLLTLAEFLGSMGYATAGFVGNTFYCSYDSGLDRGFTHYEDYVLDLSSAVRTVHLVNLTLKTIVRLGRSLGSIGEFQLRRSTHPDRKAAEEVNREFLDWLSQPRQPRRPFFAFLNYADAHAPYVLPVGRGYRFGSVPETETDFLFLLDTWMRIDKRRVSPSARTLARDSYDNCVAYVDQCLGEMLEELRHRGVLDRTLVIVLADHGEGLGEHELFEHGESLYRTEIRVPLVIDLPGGRGRSSAVVNEFVSLRDIPATIADVVSPGTRSPFPGRSLARFGRETPSSSADSSDGGAVLSELSAPNPTDPNQGRSPAYRGPMVSLAEGDFVYIRNEGDGSEQLFNERDDPYELINRASRDAMLPLLRRFRERLSQARFEVPSLTNQVRPRGIAIETHAALSPSETRASPVSRWAR